MEIFGLSSTQKHLSGLDAFDVKTARWSAVLSDLGDRGTRVAAEVDEKDVDWIKSRYAREDGGWEKEIVLFPEAKVALREIR